MKVYLVHQEGEDTYVFLTQALAKSFVERHIREDLGPGPDPAEDLMSWWNACVRTKKWHIEEKDVLEALPR